MEKGFVTLPLEEYHEIQQLRKKLYEANQDLIALKNQIRGIYTLEISDSITGDPLSQEREFRVIVNRDRLLTLLDGGSIHKEYEVVFQFAPKNNM